MTSIVKAIVRYLRKRFNDKNKDIAYYLYSRLRTYHRYEGVDFNVIHFKDEEKYIHVVSIPDIQKAKIDGLPVRLRYFLSGIARLNHQGERFGESHSLVIPDNKVLAHLINHASPNEVRNYYSQLNEEYKNVQLLQPNKTSIDSQN